MPKVPIDYAKTIIYILVHFNDLNNENVYVGHCTNMTKRKSRHKSACCNPDNRDYHLKVYQFIRENGGWDKWQMILVEKYPCDIVDEAIARERYWKRQLNATLNTNEPGRTREEWYQDNREKKLKYRKEYYQNNKEYIKQWYKNYDQNPERKEKKQQKITCECGREVCKQNMAVHRNSIVHQQWLKNNNLTIN